jgi:hypothetical protein
MMRSHRAVVRVVVVHADLAGDRRRHPAEPLGDRPRRPAPRSPRLIYSRSAREGRDGSGDHTIRCDSHLPGPCLTLLMVRSEQPISTAVSHNVSPSRRSFHASCRCSTIKYAAKENIPDRADSRLSTRQDVARTRWSRA